MTPRDRAEAIRAELEVAEADEVRLLSRYDYNVAGDLIITELLSYPQGATVFDVINDKVYPALASGPILTTVTDMCGFSFVLSLASLLLPRLVM